LLRHGGEGVFSVSTDGDTEMQNNKVNIELGNVENARTFQTGYDASIVCVAFNREFQDQPFTVAFYNGFAVIRNMMTFQWVSDYQFR
jgi:hypothetical protein